MNLHCLTLSWFGLDSRHTVVLIGLCGLFYNISLVSTWVGVICHWCFFNDVRLTLIVISDLAAYMADVYKAIHIRFISTYEW